MSTTTTAIHAVSEDETAPPVTSPAMSEQDSSAAAVVLVGLAVLLLGLIGLINSFANVTRALEPSFGGLAWMATLGIDLGILVFSALGLVLALMDMHIGWLRLVPWSLTAATIYLNIADQDEWIGRIAHAVLPGLWVVAVEVGVHAVRTRAGLASGKRMDSIRLSRWFLAPISTLVLWRRMILWEIRSYPDALARERTRLLALTELQERHGTVRVLKWRVRVSGAWRWNAPRRERALYRLGELVPTGDLPVPVPAPVPVPELTVLPAVPAKATRPARRPSRPKTAPVPSPDVVELVPLGREIADRLASEDRTLTRSALVEELRSSGRGLSNAKAGQLLTLLKEAR